MNKLFLRVAYSFTHTVQVSHAPAFERTDIGVIIIPTVNALKFSELTKLCDIHGQHPAGAHRFIVISRELVGESDVCNDDNVIPYDDEPIEEI